MEKKAKSVKENKVRLKEMNARHDRVLVERVCTLWRVSEKVLEGGPGGGPEGVPFFHWTSAGTFYISADELLASAICDFHSAPTLAPILFKH